jgi:hypothetical protein
MSYPLLPAAAVSFVIACSFELYVSIEVTGPSSSVNRLKSFGSSYWAQWKKFSWSSRGAGEPPVAVAEPVVPPVVLLLLHAESR